MGRRHRLCTDGSHQLGVLIRFHALVLCSSCHSTSPRILSNMSSVTYLGFHPSARARFALHLLFAPYHARSCVQDMHHTVRYTSTPETRTHMFIPGSCIIFLVKRRWRPFIRGAHAKLDEGLANPFRDLSAQAFAVFTKVQTIASVACTAVENAIVKYHVQVSDFTNGRGSSTTSHTKGKRRRTVVDVNVGPNMESQTDHARASPRDTYFDELGYLDRAWVPDAEVNELTGGKIIDGGGQYDMCACVSCM